MSSTRIIPPCTRKNSISEDFEGPNLEEVINMDKDKNRANKKAKDAAKKAAGNKSADGRAREPAIFRKKMNSKAPISWIDLKKNWVRKNTEN